MEYTEQNFLDIVLKYMPYVTKDMMKEGFYTWLLERLLLYWYAANIKPTDEEDAFVRKACKNVYEDIGHFAWEAPRRKG